MSDADSKENEEDVKTDVPEATPVTVSDENGPVNVGHQDNDLDLKTVKKFIIASFVVTIAAFILMLVVLRIFKKDFEGDRGVATAETRQIAGKDDALLQTQPLMDKAEYLALEEQRITMTTNAVEHAVIPVEAGKKLMLEENAFPTAEKTEAATAEAPAPAEVTESVVAVVEAPAAAPVDSSASAPVATAPQETAAVAPAVPAMITETEPAADPVLAAAGAVIWKEQCMVCHTGKKGAIGPNIEKAYGTMRKLENHDPILMDKAYIVNSLNNPAEHIAKGYPPVMTSFKQQLSDDQKEQVANYLQSQGKPIVITKPAPAPEVAAPAAEPTAVPAPVAVPTAVPEMKATPVPAPAPEAPAQPEAPAPEKPETPSGVIFV